MYTTSNCSLEDLSKQIENIKEKIKVLAMQGETDSERIDMLEGLLLILITDRYRRHEANRRIRDRFFGFLHKLIPARRKSALKN